ncbi:hypothetical protein Emed_002898 [Eimeria media]
MDPAAEGQPGVDAGPPQHEEQQQQREGADGELGDDDLDRMMEERVWCLAENLLFDEGFRILQDMMRVSFEPEVESFLRQLYDKVYVRCIDSIRRLYEGSTTLRLALAHSYGLMSLGCPDLVTWEHRRHSWNNYALLVEFLADTTCAKDKDMILLPAQWLWDMLDEFVYQFQDSCRFLQRRCKALAEAPDRKELLAELESSSSNSNSRSSTSGSRKKKESEVAAEAAAAARAVAAATAAQAAAAGLQAGDLEVWPAFRVFELLQKMVQQSGIKNLLQQQRQDPAGTKGFENEIGYQLGYFALILQLRLQTQVGLFYAAVAAVEDIEISPKAFYWRVPAAHICFVFHLGFAYMMLRRYQDAIRLMSQTLIALARQRGQLAGTASSQSATITRGVDRMHVLLLICAKLSGSKLDDSIHQTIKERYTDKYYKLQQDTEEAYCELFTWAAPRFVDPAAPPTYDEEAFERFVTGKGEVRVRICKLFLKDVESRRKVNAINSFTKLYHNIPLAKLGRLMDENCEDPQSRVRAELMAARLKSFQKVWRAGSLVSGELQQPHTEGLVDYKIEGDMVHVKNQQTQRVYVDYFVKQIEKTEALIVAAQQAVVPPASQQQQQQQQQQEGLGVSKDRRKPQVAF